MLKHKTTQTIQAALVATLLFLGLTMLLPRTAGATSLPVSVAQTYDGKCDGSSLDKGNCGIIAYIVTFTQVLSFSVGIIVTIMIVWGGIKYSMSKDNPQETAAAKTIIRNAIIALVFYLFSFAFLQWLVPGGVV